MQKSPDAFRTISEVAEELGVPAHVLRFWESKFHQISPVKRGGGRRYYRPDDVRLLRGLQRLLHGDGLTIRGAQKLLRERGVRHVVDLGAPLAAPETAYQHEATAPASNVDAPAKLPDIYARLVGLRARVAAASERDIDSL